MSPFIFKLLVGNAMMLPWYLLYRLILAKSIQYQLNRVYLLSGLTIPVILLLLDINPIVRKLQRLDIAIAHVADQSALIKGYDQIIGTENHMFFANIYIIGLIIFSSKLILQSLSLKRLHRHSQIRQILGVQVRELRENQPPFSFWRYIYLNPDLHSKEENEMILHHEKIHLRQWHTLDLVIARVIATLLWFNPVSFILCRIIQRNLEYIADKEVLRMGINKKKYQYSLLRLSMKTSTAKFTNRYAGTDLRKRIIEMNRPTPPITGKTLHGIVQAVAVICLCLVNTFQHHIAGHYAFYQQMTDLGFLQLQAKAEVRQQRNELPYLKPVTGAQKLK